MKRVVLSLLIGLQLLLPTVVVFAQSNSVGGSSNKSDPFVLIPEAEDYYGVWVDELGEKKTSGKFRDKYNDRAAIYSERGDLGAQIGSGIMNWDTIIILLGRVVIFLANGALVVGAAMIIYAGYLYAVTAISGGSSDQTAKASEAIKWALIGIVIVIFSYAILRWILHAFL